MQKIKLIETIENNVFNVFDSAGIFAYIQDAINLEWFTSDTAVLLDYMLYSNRGDKIISPSFEKVYVDEDASYEQKMVLMANIIIMKYKDNWNKLYNTYFNTTYNPITNFSSNEDENVGSEIVNSTNVKNQRYGFNTSSETGKDTTGGTNTLTTTGDYLKNRRHREVSGNNGKTYQELVKEEMDLRLTDFYEILIKNVDSVLLTGLWG